MIHYHGTPMYPQTDMASAFIGRHAMVSYEAPDQIEIAAEVCQSVVLDNGAFSAWMAGREYDFNGYAHWANHWLRHPAVEWCVIPDDIDGNEADNDALLADWLLPPAVSVPVWHMHESIDRLDTLARLYPRVALGSSGDYAEVGTPAWWGRMRQAMPVICDKEGFPRIKLHGLRMLDPGVFSKLPLASADSCNVARNVGLDLHWKASTAPRSRKLRAHILMERIEAHASASYWNDDAVGKYQNMDLFG